MEGVPGIECGALEHGLRGWGWGKGAQEGCPCVGGEGSSHLWEETLPAQKPHTGSGGHWVAYLMS